MRYLKIQELDQKRQNEEKQDIEFAGQRGKAKSKMEKELQKKLEEMYFKPNYKLSKEAPPA